MSDEFFEETPPVEPVSDEPSEVVSIPDESPPVPARAEPVALAERVASVDVLRGVALLGILAMNIVDFGWPTEVYEDPTRATGHTWADMLVWLITHIIFDTKMMTIFSMLFGAGLVLMSGRAEARGASILKIYYRRVFFLLLIGMVHAYLIWEGDILVIYAVCGFALYPFRKLSGRTLVILGLLLVLFMFPGWMLLRAGDRFLKNIEAKSQAGEDLPKWQKSMVESIEKNKNKPDETQKEIDACLTAYRGGYLECLQFRVGKSLQMQISGLLAMFWWYIAGRMLLGMGLMKLGVFSGERSQQFYRNCLIIGYGLGIPIVLGDIAINWRYNFFQGSARVYGLGGWWIGHEISGPVLVMGHIGLVMLIYKAGAFAWLTRRLAAVGRMALTNYLMHSIVFTTIFYGYGLGRFGTIHHPGLIAMTLAMWAFQLWYSPLWLERYQYGPAEWCWRSLTYWKPQTWLRERPTEVLPSTV
jgi:uncharacterized protein